MVNAHHLAGGALVALALVFASAGCAPDAGRAPGPSAPTPVTTSALATRLEAARADYGAPGALAVVLHGDRREAAAVGSADLDGTPVRVDDRFRIASITKPFVGVLALQSVDAGLLSLDDPITPGPDIPLRAEPAVTLRQVLDHTSGIVDFYTLNPQQAVAALTDPELRAEGTGILEALTAGRPAPASDRLLIAAAETSERDFAPGTEWRYSNTGFQVAAATLTRATGRPLADLLRTGIVEPLGLTRTSLAPADASSPEFRGYEYGTDGTPVDTADDVSLFGNGGNGGVLSTVDDLATFFRALVRGDLLSAAKTQAMLGTSPSAAAAGKSYNLGIATYYLSCGTFYGHEGGVSGTASIALVSDDGDDVVVISFNARGLGDPRLPALADELVCA